MKNYNMFNNNKIDKDEKELIKTFFKKVLDNLNNTKDNAIELSLNYEHRNILQGTQIIEEHCQLRLNDDCLINKINTVLRSRKLNYGLIFEHKYSEYGFTVCSVSGITTDLEIELTKRGYTQERYRMTRKLFFELINECSSIKFGNK